MKTRWKALASAVVAAALVVAPLTVAGASAHTGDLHATATCDTGSGKYIVTYTLETSNVPAGRTGSTVWRIGDSHFDGTPTNANNMANPVSSTGNQTITLGTATLAGNTTGAGPWVYAFTTWKDDQGHVVATKGSDTQVLGLKGDCAPIKKVFVCKYVGTPGVDEKLQTGNNPISVSVNAIPQWDGKIPSWFSDSHGRSYVIAYDTGQTEPTKADCAAPAPTVVTPKPPVVKDKCETANDHYGLPAATVGVSYTRSGKDIIATPATGYVFGTLPAGWSLNADKSATYAFQSSQFTNNENCEEIADVPAVFLATPVPPTCKADGELPSLGEHPNVTLTWDRVFAGPGVYTLTATANAGFEFEDGSTVKKQDFTVAGKLAANSETCTPPVLNSCVPGQGALSTNLNDLWSNVDTRTKGHVEYVSGGLHVWTDDSTSQSKVSEGIAKAFALRNTGILDINATKNPGNVYQYGPGLNLFVDFDNDGDIDGTLVYEEVYGQDLWLTGGSQQFVKDAAPSHTGGNGSENHGTINEWLKVFPNAQVKGVAYTLGSGVQGDWTITSIVVNCSEYTFDTAPTTPVPAVFSATPVAPTCLTEGALPTLGEHPNVSLVFDRTYAGPGAYTLTATANEGYTFPDGSTVKTKAFTVAGKLAPQSTDAAAPCYQAPPVGDPVPSTPATPAALPATGGVDMLPWGIGGAAMLLAGAAALIMTRRFARR